MSTSANAAGANAIPNRFGHNTPQPNRSHGNAGKATLSTPVTTSAAVLRPKSCRTNRRHDSGQTSTVTTAQSTLAATGTLVPVDIITSDPKSCHAPG